MRDEDHFRQAFEYIHQNPVKAGLVARPEDWRWSSADPGNANLLMGVFPSANQEIGVPGHNANPGNANLLMGVFPSANQEIGVPGHNANQEIDDPGHNANQEIGVPGHNANPGNANLLIGAGENANQEIGVPGEKP